MKIQEYRQTTFESCLAVCLLQFCGKITRKKELEVIDHAIRFSRDSFSLGHIDYIKKHYGKGFRLILDNKPYKKYLDSLGTGIEIEQMKISLKSLEFPCILYIDTYHLSGEVHYPHFIIVLEKIDDSYRIYDPWEGKVISMDSKTLSRCISGLRNHLKFCPQMIVL